MFFSLINCRYPLVIIIGCFDRTCICNIFECKINYKIQKVKSVTTFYNTCLFLFNRKVTRNVVFIM